jgi:molecular chaperone DnaJ
MISVNRGWYSQGYQDVQTAVSMEPSNYEYKEALNRLQNNNRSYTNYSQNYTRGSNDDLCQMCTCLLCSDQICECCGGDLISCC